MSLALGGTDYSVVVKTGRRQRREREALGSELLAPLLRGVEWK